ncbi:unnamed protein product [Polarella glacialis]|uniref:Sulfotransferase domain-containing protein n=1 Tax=Polarella glacialis TaxID=89957 RepID=A0A813FWB9_POLGL|nr:unnamed protein product [Polarella glacialis]
MKFTRLVLGLAFPPLLAANNSNSNDNDNNENSVTCGVDRRLGGEAIVDEFSGGKAEGTLMLQVGGQRYQQPSASIGNSTSQAPKLPAAAPSTSLVPAATSSSLCSSGRLLPEFYILGAPKCGTTSLAELAMTQLGVQPAIMPRYEKLAAAYDGEFTNDDSFLSQKEFHFFDLVSEEAPAEVLGNATHVRELWLRVLPLCPPRGGAKQVLADFTAMNILHAAPWPPLPSLPPLLHDMYGSALASQLTFVVMLRDPLDRMQSQFYYQERVGHAGIYANLTFSQGMELELSMASSGVPPPMSSPSMYGILLKTWLEVFPARQFLVVPSPSRVSSGWASSLCPSLATRLSVTGASCAASKEDSEINTSDHPPLLNDTTAAGRAAAYWYFQSDFTLLVQTLTSARQQGMELDAFSGDGSEASVAAWLLENGFDPQLQREQGF